MPIDPDELPKTKQEIVLGEDIYTWSEPDLTARIAALEEEIAHCRAAIAARRATKSAADTFFKR